MNYELAKQLKDAGFPQKYSNGKRFWMYDSSDDDYTKIIHDGNIDNALDDEQLFYIPTLSELIDTCGDNFVALSKMGEDWYCAENGVPVRLIANESKTPEEAVAKLWLALNKK